MTSAESVGSDDDSGHSDACNRDASRTVGDSGDVVTMMIVIVTVEVTPCTNGGVTLITALTPMW